MLNLKKKGKALEANEANDISIYHPICNFKDALP